MAEGSHKICKGSSSSDTLLSGEPTRPVGRPTVHRVYPTGLGLRPKACPRPHTATGLSTRDALPVQGPVDRCLTIVRTMNTVRFDSIVVLAGGRRRCIGLGGVGFAPSNEDLAFRAGVCHLMNLFLRTMFKLRQGPVQFLGLFFGH